MLQKKKKRKPTFERKGKNERLFAGCATALVKEVLPFLLKQRFFGTKEERKQYLTLFFSQKDK